MTSLSLSMSRLEAGGTREVRAAVDPGRPRNVLPGFGVTMGVTVAYLSLVVLIPLTALAAKASTAGAQRFWGILREPRTLEALGLSFGGAALAAAINTVCGFVVAWVLVRYQFWGKRLVDALVDLPFAMPTAVSGIALTAIYAPEGWVGRWLPFQVAYGRLGVLVAMTFISIPFVIRTLEPALEELERDVEEAAASLGASRWATFRRVIFPAVLPATITGFALALARAVGEYGSVVFISGNKPHETEIAPLLIMFKLEQNDAAGAAVIAVLMLVGSLGLLLGVNGFQWWASRRARGVQDAA